MELVLQHAATPLLECLCMQDMLALRAASSFLRQAVAQHPYTHTELLEARHVFPLAAVCPATRALRTEMSGGASALARVLRAFPQLTQLRWYEAGVLSEAMQYWPRKDNPAASAPHKALRTLQLYAHTRHSYDRVLWRCVALHDVYLHMDASDGIAAAAVLHAASPTASITLSLKANSEQLESFDDWAARAASTAAAVPWATVLDTGIISSWRETSPDHIAATMMHLLTRHPNLSVTVLECIGHLFMYPEAPQLYLQVACTAAAAIMDALPRGRQRQMQAFTADALARALTVCSKHPWLRLEELVDVLCTYDVAWHIPDDTAGVVDSIIYALANSAIDGPATPWYSLEARQRAYAAALRLKTSWTHEKSLHYALRGDLLLLVAPLPVWQAAIQGWTLAMREARHAPRRTAYLLAWAFHIEAILAHVEIMLVPEWAAFFTAALQHVSYWEVGKSRGVLDFLSQSVAVWNYICVHDVLRNDAIDAVIFLLHQHSPWGPSHRAFPAARLLWQARTGDWDGFGDERLLRMAVALSRAFELAYFSDVYSFHGADVTEILETVLCRLARASDDIVRRLRADILTMSRLRALHESESWGASMKRVFAAFEAQGRSLWE